jgi:hypothetical protein
MPGTLRPLPASKNAVVEKVSALGPSRPEKTRSDIGASLVHEEAQAHSRSSRARPPPAINRLQPAMSAVRMAGAELHAFAGQVVDGSLHRSGCRIDETTSPRGGKAPQIGRSQRKSEPTGNTNFDLNRRASLRPYLGARGVEIPPRDSPVPSHIRRDFIDDDRTKSLLRLATIPHPLPQLLDP